MPHVTPLWKRARVETILSYAVPSAILVTAVVFLGDEIGRHVRDFEEWTDGLGPWAMVVFVLLYAVLSSVCVPDTLLGIVAGASFGFTRGLAVVAVSSLIGATLQYALSRRLFKAAIDGAVASKPTLAAIQAAVRQQELRLQVLLRLTPLNRAMTSYVLGAAGVRLVRFLVAFAAILPNLCLEVYFGYAGKHLAKVAGQLHHTAVLHDIAMVAGLAVAITVMVLVSRMARKAVDAATADTM